MGRWEGFTARAGAVLLATVVIMAAEATGDGASKRRALLFQRYITEDGAAKQGVLEAALFQDEHVELRQLHTFGKAKSFFVPLGVSRGKLYALDLSELVVVDLHVGTVELVEKLVGARYFSTPCFYHFVRGEDGYSRQLRVYDFDRGLRRTIELPAPAPFEGTVAPLVSPDRKTLAYYVPEGWPEEKPEHFARKHIVTIALESGAVRKSDSAHLFIPGRTGGGGFASAGFGEFPLRLLDSVRLLMVETVGIEPRGGGYRHNPDAYHQILSYNVRTGDHELVTRVPGNIHRTDFALVDPGRFDGVRLRLTAWPEWVSSDYLLDADAGRLVEDTAQGCLGYRIVDTPAGTLLRYGDLVLDQAGRYALVQSPRTGQVAWSAMHRFTLPRRALFYFELGLSGPLLVTPTWVNEEMLWFDPQELQAVAEPQVSEGWEPIRSEPFPKRDWPPPGSRNVRDAFVVQLSAEKGTYALHEPVPLTIVVRNVSDTDFEISEPGFSDQFASLSVRWPRVGATVSDYQEPSDKTVLLAAGEEVDVPVTIEFPEETEYRVEATFKGYRKPVDSTTAWVGRRDVKSDEILLVVEATEDDARLAAAKVDRLVARTYTDTKGDPRLWSRAAGNLRDMGPPAEDRLIGLARQETELARLRLLLRSLARIKSDGYLDVLFELWQRDEPEAKLLALDHLGRFADRDEVRPLLMECVKSSDKEFLRQTARALSRRWDLALQPVFERFLFCEDEAARETAAHYLLALPLLPLDQRISQLLPPEDAVSFALARALVADLEQGFHFKQGEFPEGTWQEVARNEARLKQYRKTLEAWRQWASENPRASARFFHQQRRRWGHLVW